MSLSVGARQIAEAGRRIEQFHAVSGQLRERASVKLKVCEKPKPLIVSEPSSSATSNGRTKPPTAAPSTATEADATANGNWANATS